MFAAAGGRFRGAMVADDFSRDSDNGGVRRNVVYHHRICADSRAIPNRDRPNNLRARSDEHVVANDWALPPLRPDGDLMFDLHVRPAAHRAVDDDPDRMNQHEPRSEIRSAADNAIATNGIDA